jgi:sec-independent protein translocase protein TatB
MPSTPDFAFIVLLALLLFGPKKLPVLARQLGKLMADFRRASNEFRTQMEEELRISEQADRQKQVAAIEAATPATPALDIPEPEHPHLPPPPPSFTSESASSESTSQYLVDSPYDPPASSPEASVDPVPIAVSGDLSILPPSTGLPIANSGAPSVAEPIPVPPAPDSEAQPETKSPAHDAEFETETLHG